METIENSQNARHETLLTRYVHTYSDIMNKLFSCMPEKMDILPPTIERINLKF